MMQFRSNRRNTIRGLAFTSIVAIAYDLTGDPTALGLAQQQNDVVPTP